MSTPAVKSTQIVAGVAVVLALLGGAYAVGRSQSALPPPLADGQPPAVMQSGAKPADAAPQRMASAEPAREVREARPDPASERSQPALCQSCGRVTEVHTETRKGKASGVGAVGGAVVGGLLGNMVGGGTGKKIATVGGAVAGGYAGNEIEKNQKTYSVWIIQVQERYGRTRRFERSADPGLRVGDEVKLTENGFSRV